MNKQKTICGDSKPDYVPKGRIAKQCDHCRAWFHLPSCHAARHRCCSKECSLNMGEEKKNARQRNCKNCGAPFIPRPRQIRLNQGVYCSIQCLGQVLQTYKTPEMEEKRISAMKKRMAAGEWTFLKGEENPLWMGGAEEARKRRTANGKDAEYQRKYKAENPERAKEWSQKRLGAYLERLPYGTIPKLLSLQKNRCAACGVSTNKGYHVDHIIPLSKGGEHAPRNLQILCPKCNLRKSAMMPHEFAQRMGKLL